MRSARTTADGLIRALLLTVCWASCSPRSRPTSIRDHAGFTLRQAASIGSTFFMATGFHGFHVIIGTIFLIVCLMRA